MSEFLSKESVQKHSQCKKNLIGIAAYPKHNVSTPYLVSYSETLNGSPVDYVDIFGVMLVKLAVKLTDVSMCDLYITSLDSQTGEYVNPLENNPAAVRLLLHVGPTVVHVKTVDGEINYNRKKLQELL